MNDDLHELELMLAGERWSLLAPEPARIQEQYRAAQDAGSEPEPPYWTRLWPSALALADWLALHPEWIRGRSVLELAAGLGLPALFAARYATRVTASDYLPEAVELLARNAERLGIGNFEATLLDWNALPVHLSADVLLLSDVNYAPAFFPVLRQVVERFISAGTLILLATPQRNVGAPFIESIQEWIREQELVSVEGTQVALYRLKG